MWDEEWEYMFLFSLNILNELECLVCNQVLTMPYYNNLKRHYDRCHPELHSVIGEQRTQMIIKLKQDFQLKNLRTQAICARASAPVTVNSQAKGIYTISLALARNGRPFEDVEFFKNLCLSVMPLLGEAGQQIVEVIQAMPLSSTTIIRRTVDIGHFIQFETKERLKNASFISVCFDESVDISNTRQMFICIKTVDSHFNSFEEILKLESFSKNITGEAIYEAFKKNVLSLVETQKLSAICTGGYPAMIGQNQGFVGQLKKAGIQISTFQCVIHQEALFSKSMGLKETMQTVIKIINRLREFRNGLTNKKLIIFLKEVDAYYGEALTKTEMNWLNRGKCLEHLLNVKTEIENFLQSQSFSKNADILNSLNCHNFLYDLSFLVDMTQNISDLNVALQRKDKTIIELLHVINLFLRKLITLRDQIACQNLSNFPKTQEIFIQFPNTEILQVLINEMDLLLENFQIRFKDLLSLQWIIDIYNSPLTCSMENLPDNIKAELTLMRQDLLVPMEMGINFWKNICPQKYPIIRESILKLFSMFTSTYICDSAFLAMSQIKCGYRAGLTDSNLETLVKIKTYDKEIDINKLIEFINARKQKQFFKGIM